MTDLTPETLAEWQRVLAGWDGSEPLDFGGAEVPAPVRGLLERAARAVGAEQERDQVRETAARLRRAKDELVDDRANLRVRVAELEAGIKALADRVQAYHGELASDDLRFWEKRTPTIEAIQQIAGDIRALTEKRT